MKFAVNSKVLHKCQAILGRKLFMKNVAAQVALQTVRKDKRGRADGAGEGGSCGPGIRRMTEPDVHRSSKDLTT